METASVKYSLPSIDSSSVLDMLGKILSIYSAYFTTSGKGKKTLRPQLIKIMAVYILYGYNSESKKVASEICGLTDKMRIDALNKELRDSGYLIKSEGNDRISYLNPDLAPLGENFKIINKNISVLKNKGVDSLKLNLEFDIKLP